MYGQLLKPILFKIDPEFVHDLFTFLGRALGSNPITRWATHLCFGYTDPCLETTIAGIRFKSPIGLAAGFDKNAFLTKLLPELSFGFEEVGSITGEPCKGNPKPRLWRHPELKSIRVYYGLKNDGCRTIAKRLKKNRFKIPIGTSIAKTNSPKTCDLETGINDYVKAFKTLASIGAYFTINLSCPNAYGGQPFTDPIRLDKLLKRLDKIQTKKAIFLKLSPDLSEAEVNRLIAVAQRHRIHGFVCTNLTKKHTLEKGGLSGKAVEELSLKQIRHIKAKTKGKMAIIACGGVFSTKDAIERLETGADLIQLITGMIYEGPQLISEINRGLAAWKNAKFDVLA